MNEADYKHALGIAIDALIFYADEASYHAIAILADRPAGRFADDFSVVEGSEYDRPMPGKLAREALKKLENEHGDLSFTSLEE